MKPRIDGTLHFTKSSDATTFMSLMDTVTDRLDVKGEKSRVERDGDTVNLSLFFDNMNQIQRLRTWAQNNNLGRKLKTAVSDDDVSSLTFHQCMHDQNESCKEVTKVI